MKARLYLETTVPSYLTAWPSRDLIRAGHQQITREWWQTRRRFFHVFISQLVLDEAAAGDATAARERLAVVRDLPLLDITDDVTSLAAALVASLALPTKAATDAAHIALAAVHGMHFLLTWNCAHIANAEMSVAIDRVRRENVKGSPLKLTIPFASGNLLLSFIRTDRFIRTDPFTVLTAKPQMRAISRTES